VQFKYIDGATPIDANEAAGLIPKNILLQSELNEIEQSNILKAEIWLSSHKMTLEKFATVEFMKKSHRKMFDKTWRWAGQFRLSNKNIGINWNLISTNLKNLCDDTIYYISNKNYSNDEMAVRFHHRLVSIHCFPNGNGRHARIVTNYLLYLLGENKFSWGKDNLIKVNITRNNYILALKQADEGSYEALLSFVRS